MRSNRYTLLEHVLYTSGAGAALIVWPMMFGGLLADARWYGGAALMGAYAVLALILAARHTIQREGDGE